MAIPESQLETWSHQGATVTAKSTHETIRRELEHQDSPLASKDVDIYLQFSYRNSTNIRGDSDVDIVVQLNGSFWRDISRLPSDQQALYRDAYSDATYHWADFRQDVLDTLRERFGYHQIVSGNKSIKVSADSGRLAADVVPCLQFRSYRRFFSLSDQSYVEGIKSLTQNEGREVINFPKLHYENGACKNSADNTNGWYKPFIRVCKNARNAMISERILHSQCAPSYFVECLLYNVPDNCFGGSFEDTYCDVVRWLQDNPPDSFVCQNEQTYLFGNEPEQWSLDYARAFVEGMITLWNQW